MKPLPKNIQAWINEELSGHTIAAHTSKSDFPCHYEIAQRRMAHYLLEVIEMQQEALEDLIRNHDDGCDCWHHQALSRPKEILGEVDGEKSNE